MKKKTKHVGWAIVFFVFLCWASVAQTQTQKLETLTGQASGKEQLDILIQLVERHWESDPQKFLDYSKKALDLMRLLREPNSKRKMGLLSHISSMLCALGKYSEAQTYADRSLSISKKIGDKDGEADSSINLGEIKWYLGEYRQSGDYFNEALTLFQKSKENKPGVAKAYLWIGQQNWKLGNFSMALDYVFKSTKLYEELGDKRGVANSNNMTAIIYWEMGEYKKCINRFLEIKELFMEIEDPRGVAKTTNNLGLTYLKVGEYKKSLEFFKSADQMNLRLGIRHYRSNTLNNIGEVYMAMKDYREALDYFSKSLKIKEELNDRRGISYTLINMGVSNRELANYNAAYTRLDSALSIAEQINTKTEILKASLELSQTYAIRGNYREALHFFKKYKKTNDLVFNEQSRQKIDLLLTNYEIDKKEKEIRILKKNKHIEELSLVRRKNLNLSIIIISILAIFLAFLLYSRVRLKNRVNLILTGEINEHKRTSQKLRESEEKFKTLAEKSVVGIYIVQDNTVQYVNPRLLSILGYEREEIIGKNPLSFVSENDRQEMETFLALRLLPDNKKDTSCYEFRGITKSGSIVHIESYGTQILYKNRPAVLETIIDITRRKRMEEELAKSQKLESIGILAGGIAHDFNNMLTVIIGGISLALDDLGNDPVVAPMLEASLNATSQCTELAQRLITFSRGGWINPVQLEFDTILKEALDYYPDVKPFVRWISYQSRLKTIYGDERQLRQVIIYLLQNAEEATREKNDRLILIETENIVLNQENKYTLSPGEYLKISIKDNGDGIPPDRIGKIFDPDRKGLGLGLPICYSIIRKHHGHISVQSEAGKGSTVELLLP